MVEERRGRRAPRLRALGFRLSIPAGEREEWPDIAGVRRSERRKAALTDLACSCARRRNATPKDTGRPRGHPCPVGASQPDPAFDQRLG